MKLLKRFSPFFLILIIGVITFRFLFFISYLDLQKQNLRSLVFSEKNKDLLLLKISKDDIFENKNGLEWKENNKELVIGGLYHEVVSIQSFKNYSLVYVKIDDKENKLRKDFFDCNNEINEDGEGGEGGLDFFLDLDYLDVKHQLSLISYEQDELLRIRKDQFYDFQFYLKKIKPPRV